MRDLDGAAVSLSNLRPHEVYVTARSQTKFGARAGDQVTIYAGGNAVDATVRAVVRYHGAGSDGPAVLMPLARAQAAARAARSYQSRADLECAGTRCPARSTPTRCVSSCSR